MATGRSLSGAVLSEGVLLKAGHCSSVMLAFIFLVVDRSEAGVLDLLVLARGFSTLQQLLYALS